VTQSRGIFFLFTTVLLIVLILLFLFSFLIGTVPITLSTVISIITTPITHAPHESNQALEQIILGVRLPQIILAILVGAALSVAGASYQTIFKNPMVSSDILGVSAGAGFCASLAMLMNSTWLVIQISAFIGGIGAVTLSWLISRFFGRHNLTILILAGVVVGSFFQALISVIKTFADTDNVLPSITFWLMGSLSKGKVEDVYVLLPAIFLSMFLLFIFRNHINVLAAGNDEARAMGVNVALVKAIVVVAATLMCACAVSVAGIIGWIGMVVPHIARSVCGASYARLLPTSFLIGGILLLLIHDLIRASLADLPLGVLTALIGTPLFVLLLIRTRKEWLS
jgi:hypothetical protein